MGCRAGRGLESHIGTLSLIFFSPIFLFFFPLLFLSPFPLLFFYSPSLFSLFFSLPFFFPLLSLFTLASPLQCSSIFSSRCHKTRGQLQLLSMQYTCMPTNPNYQEKNPFFYSTLHRILSPCHLYYTDDLKPTHLTEFFIN